MSLLKNIRLSSASKQCAASPGGPQRLVYVVSAADKDKHASAVPPHCDSVVLAAFTRSKQRYGAPRLTDELRRAQGYPFNQKNRGGKPAPSGTEGKGLPEVQPGQLPRTRPACVRKSVGAGFLRQWPEPEVAGHIRRTYVQMKAGCIWQWSLTCGHVPLLAGHVATHDGATGLRCPADGAVAA